MAGQTTQVTMKINADTSAAQKQMIDLMRTLQNIQKANFDSAFNNLNFDKAAQSAATLADNIARATNADTGKLDLVSLSSNLRQSGTSAAELANNLLKAGQMGQQAFMQLSTAIASSEVPLKRMNTTLANMATTLRNTVKWELSSAAVHGLESALSGAVSYVKNLNSSLNDIRIVTGQSVEDMARFAQQANIAAKTLSTTTKAYSDASLIYYQQGDSAEQAAKKAAITIKAANASFGSSAAEMSEYLTAVWNSYKVGADELERYVDIMAALGAKTATSLEEIATSMQKVAATANTVGVSMEQVSSIIATVSSVTRESAESIGTSYKTIFARMGDLKLGGTDDGIGLGQVSSQLKSIGVNVLDATGNLRDMGDIITDLGNKWQTMSAAQKTATAQVVAGKRQYTQLMALFENWDMYNKNLDISINADGSLNEMANTYAESWEAASNRLKAAFEGIYGKLLNDEALIKFTNGLTKVVELADKVVSAFGGLPGILGIAGSLLTKMFSTQIAQGATTMVQKIGNFVPQIPKVVANMFRPQSKQKSYQNLAQSKYDKELATQETQYKQILASGKYADGSAEQQQLKNTIEIIGRKRELLTLEKALGPAGASRAAEAIQGLQREMNAVQQLKTEYANMQKEQAKQRKASKNILVGRQTQGQKVASTTVNPDGTTSTTYVPATIDTSAQSQQMLNSIVVAAQLNAASRGVSGVTGINNWETASAAIQSTGANYNIMTQAGTTVNDVNTQIQAMQNATTQQDRMATRQQIANDLALDARALTKINPEFAGQATQEAQRQMASFTQDLTNKAIGDDTIAQKYEKLKTAIAAARVELEGLQNGLKKDLSQAAGDQTDDIKDAVDAEIDAMDERAQEESEAKRREAKKEEDERKARENADKNTRTKKEKTKWKDLTDEQKAEKIGKGVQKASAGLASLTTGLSMGQAAFAAWGEEGASATDKVNAGLQAASGIAMGFATGGLVGGIAAVVGTAAGALMGYLEQQEKLEEERKQAQRDAAKEAVESTEKELQTQQDLMTSFRSLLNAKKEGAEVDAELAEAATKLGKAYNVVGASMANLTGNYDEFIENVQEAASSVNEYAKAEASLAKAQRAAEESSEITDKGWSQADRSHRQVRLAEAHGYGGVHTNFWGNVTYTRDLGSEGDKLGNSGYTTEDILDMPLGKWSNSGNGESFTLRDILVGDTEVLISSKDSWQYQMDVYNLFKSLKEWAESQGIDWGSTVFGQRSNALIAEMSPALELIIGAQGTELLARQNQLSSRFLNLPENYDMANYTEDWLELYEEFVTLINELYPDQYTPEEVSKMAIDFVAGATGLNDALSEYDQVMAAALEVYNNDVQAATSAIEHLAAEGKELEYITPEVLKAYQTGNKTYYDTVYEREKVRVKRDKAVSLGSEMRELQPTEDMNLDELKQYEEQYTSLIQQAEEEYGLTGLLSFTELMNLSIEQQIAYMDEIATIMDNKALTLAEQTVERLTKEKQILETAMNAGFSVYNATTGQEIILNKTQMGNFADAYEQDWDMGIKTLEKYYFINDQGVITRREGVVLEPGSDDYKTISRLKSSFGGSSSTRSNQWIVPPEAGVEPFETWDDVMTYIVGRSGSYSLDSASDFGDTYFIPGFSLYDDFGLTPQNYIYDKHQTIGWNNDAQDSAIANNTRMVTAMNNSVQQFINLRDKLQANGIELTDAEENLLFLQILQDELDSSVKSVNRLRSALQGLPTDAKELGKLADDLGLNMQDLLALAEDSEQFAQKMQEYLDTHELQMPAANASDVEWAQYIKEQQARELLQQEIDNIANQDSLNIIADYSSAISTLQQAITSFYKDGMSEMTLEQRSALEMLGIDPDSIHDIDTLIAIMENATNKAKQSFEAVAEYYGYNPDAFRLLSTEEYNALSDDDKKSYDIVKAQYEIWLKTNDAMNQTKKTVEELQIDTAMDSASRALKNARDEWQAMSAAAESARQTISGLFGDFDKLNFESTETLRQNLIDAGIEATKVSEILDALSGDADDNEKIKAGVWAATNATFGQIEALAEERSNYTTLVANKVDTSKVDNKTEVQAEADINNPPVVPPTVIPVSEVDATDATVDGTGSVVYLGTADGSTATLTNVTYHGGTVYLQTADGSYAKVTGVNYSNGAVTITNADGSTATVVGVNYSNGTVSIVKADGTTAQVVGVTYENGTTKLQFADGTSASVINAGALIGGTTFLTTADGTNLKTVTNLNIQDGIAHLTTADGSTISQGISSISVDGGVAHLKTADGSTISVGVTDISVDGGTAYLTTAKGDKLTIPEDTPITVPGGTLQLDKAVKGQIPTVDAQGNNIFKVENGQLLIQTVDEKTGLVGWAPAAPLTGGVLQLDSATDNLSAEDKVIDGGTINITTDAVTLNVNYTPGEGTDLIAPERTTTVTVNYKESAQNEMTRKAQAWSNNLYTTATQNDIVTAQSMDLSNIRPYATLWWDEDTMIEESIATNEAQQLAMLRMTDEINQIDWNNATPEQLTFFNEYMSVLETMLNSSIPEIREIGWNLVASLPEGARECILSLDWSSTVRGLGPMALTALMTETQEKSPSRLTRPVGIWLIEGVEVGISEGVANFNPDVAGLGDKTLKALRSEFDFDADETGISKLITDALVADMISGKAYAEGGVFAGVLTASDMVYNTDGSWNKNATMARGADRYEATWQAGHDAFVAQEVDKAREEYVNRILASEDHITARALHIKNARDRWITTTSRRPNPKFQAVTADGQIAKLPLSDPAMNFVAVGKEFDDLRATAARQEFDRTMATRVADQASAWYQQTYGTAQDARDKFWKRIEEAGEEYTAKWLTDGYKTSKELTEMQKAIIAETTNGIEINAENANEVLNQVQNTLDARSAELNIQINKAIAQVKDTWVSGLNQMYKNDVEAAKELYDLWSSTFEAIADARQALLSGESIGKTLYNDSEKLSDIILTLMGQGMSSSEIETFLFNPNADISKLMFTPFSASQWRYSGQQENFDYGPNGTLLDFNYANYTTKAAAQATDYVNSLFTGPNGFINFQNQVNEWNKKLAEGDVATIGLVEELERQGILKLARDKDGNVIKDKNGNITIDTSDLETTFKNGNFIEMITRAFIKSLTLSEDDARALWAEGKGKEIAYRGQLVTKAEAEYETISTEAQQDLNIIAKARQALIKGEDLDATLNEEEEARLLALTNATDLNSVSLTNLDNATVTLTNTMLNAAQALAQIIPGLQNGSITGYTLNSNGTVKSVMTAYGALNGDTSQLTAAGLKAYREAETGYYTQYMAENGGIDAFLSPAARYAIPDVHEHDAALSMARVNPEAQAWVAEQMAPYSFETNFNNNTPVDTGVYNKLIGDLDPNEMTQLWNEYASAVGYTTEQYQDYAQVLYETAGGQGQLLDQSNEIQESYMQLAQKVINIEKAWEDLSGAQKENIALLKSGQTQNSKYGSALKGVTKDIKKIFGDSLKDTEKFVKENIALIEKMANGEEGAAEAVEEAFLKTQATEQGWNYDQEVQVSFDVDHDGLTDQLTTIGELLNNFGDEHAKKPVGFKATLDNTPALAGLQSLLDAGAMTVDQMNAALGAIGWEPQIEMVPYDAKIHTAQQLAGGYRLVNGKYVSVGGSVSQDTDQTIYIPTIKGAKKTGGGASGVRPQSSNGGGGGGDKKPKHEEKLDLGDEIDRYHEVNERLKRMGELLEKISIYKNRAFGQGYLKNLAQEIKMLQAEEKMYQRKAKEAQLYYEQDSAHLTTTYGATYDEYGNVNNYDEITAGFVSQINREIEYYNNLTAAEQKKLDEQYENDGGYIAHIKKPYEEWQKDLAKTEESLATWNEALIDAEESFNKISTAVLDGITYKAEYQIDLNDRDRELLEFFVDRYEDDLNKQAESFEKLIAQGAELAENTAALKQKQADLNAAYEAGLLSNADYAEGLKAVQDALLENAEALLALEKNVKEFYGNTLEMISEAFQEQVDHITAATDAMQSYINILGLMGKGQNYSEKVLFYGQRAEFAQQEAIAKKAHLDLLLGQKADFDALIASGRELTEVEKQWYEDLLNAIDDANGEFLESVETALTYLQEKYQNAVAKISEDLDKALSGSFGSLEGLSDAYSYYTEVQGRYVSAARELYEVSKLNRDIEMSIEDATTSASKKMLKDLQDRINKQSELNQLTEYDIEMNRLQYELALAKIGLEEAQNAKDTVRLTRDESGNYIYQYTADNDKINEAQQTYEDVLQQINDLALNRVQELEQGFVETRQRYKEQYDAIVNDMNLTDDQRAAKLADLNERFKADMEYYAKQMEIAAGNLTTSNSTIMQVYSDDLRTVSMTTRDGINEDIAALIENKDQAIESFKQAVANATTLSSEHQKAIDAFTSQTVGDYTAMSNAATKYGDDVDKAMQKAQEAVGQSTEDMLNKIRDLGASWEGFIDGPLDAFIDGIIDLAEEIQDTLDWLAQLETATATTPEPGPEPPANINPTPQEPTGDEEEEEEDTKSEGTRKWRLAGYKASWNGNEKTYDTKREADIALASWKNSYVERKRNEAVDYAYDNFDDYQERDNYINQAYASARQFVNSNPGSVEAVKEWYTEYKTGGLADFTGPAWLDGTKSHPELVLNATDTQNMLQAVHSLRELDTESITMLLSALGMATASLFGALNGNYHASGISGSNVQELNQNVEIHADFPNVTDKNEIVEAIDDLVNRASQFAQKKIW